jgi:hypothetical protein
MLTAKQVKEIVNYTAEDLTRLIQERYTTDGFLTAEFLQLNDNGAFVFDATWYNEEEDSEDTVKVFVRSKKDTLIADY